MAQYGQQEKSRRDQADLGLSAGGEQSSLCAHEVHYNGIIREGAKLVNAVADSRVPKLTETRETRPYLSLSLPAPGPLPLASLPDRDVDSGPEGDGAGLGVVNNRGQTQRIDQVQR